MIELSNRQLEILYAIIASYIKSGEPVSSGTVYAVLKLDVCASTIRSDMSELTAKGFIRKIHSSSGSIPSDRGYRLYASTIADKLSYATDSDSVKAKLGRFLRNTEGTFGSLACELLNAVSKSTNCLAFFHFENLESIGISKIQLVRVLDSAICIFVVFSDGSVKNKVLQIDRPFEQSELRCMEGLLGEYVVGTKLKDFSVVLLQGLVAKNGVRLPHLSAVLSEIADLVRGFLGDDFYFSSIPVEMFRSFENKLTVFRVLNFMKDRFLLSDYVSKNRSNVRSVAVSVGEENSYLGLGDFSIISSACGVSKALSGRVGVVGPVRMDYTSALYNLVCVSPFFSDLLLRCSKGNLSRNRG